MSNARLFPCLAAFATLTTASPPSASAQTPPAPNMRLPVAGRGYTFTPPQDWGISRTDGDLIMVYSQGEEFFKAFVILSVERRQNLSTLAAATNGFTKAERAKTGFKILGQSVISLKGVFGSRSNYLCKDGMPLHLERLSRVTVIREKTVYTFTYESLPRDYAKYHQEFELLLQSVRWNETQWQGKKKG